MAILVEWITEPNIIRFIVHQDLTPEDLETIGQIGGDHVLLRNLYTLIDFSDVHTLPRHLATTALRSTAFLNFVNHPNAHWFAIVRPNSAVHYMVEIVMRNTRVKIVETHEAGETFLKACAAEEAGEA